MNGNITPGPPPLQNIIGQRIRDRRKANRMTLLQLAEKTGLSKPLLSKIENGRVASPISTLSSIANALDMRLANIIDDNNPQKNERNYTLIRRGQGVDNDVHPIGVYQTLTADRLMAATVITASDEQYDKNCIVMFSHPGEELLYVLEGKMDYVYGDDEFQIEAGDALYMDATVPHGGRKVGDEPFRALIVFCEG